MVMMTTKKMMKWNLNHNNYWLCNCIHSSAPQLHYVDHVDHEVDIDDEPDDCSDGMETCVGVADDDVGQ